MEAGKVRDLPYTHGDSRRLVAQFRPKSEGLRTGCAAGAWAFQPQGGRPVSHLKLQGRAGIEFSLPPPFCPIQALD